ncbi:hypothetical protein BaRGS_00027592 [Batillaria attramentaria]|uniref:Uncharacterized protein n=1 Tax=Batillaria attramentaria TaxID=370345 RepID=A0ABD0K1P2_9CAEN
MTSRRNQKTTIRNSSCYTIHGGVKRRNSSSITQAKYEELKDTIGQKRDKFRSRREMKILRAAEELQQANQDDDHADDMVPIADQWMKSLRKVQRTTKMSL